MFALTLLAYWLVISGETSSLKPQQRPTLLGAAAAAALTAPSPGPGGGGHCVPRRSARGEGQLALRDAHLLPGFSCSGRVAGSD